MHHDIDRVGMAQMHPFVRMAHLVNTNDLNGMRN